MIKRICKQCGKEFTLNDSEIKFYKEKNLDLPKRCSECRKENKNNKDDLNNTYNKNLKSNNSNIDNNSKDIYNSLKNNENKNNKNKTTLGSIVAAGLIVLFLIISKFFNIDLDWNTIFNNQQSTQQQNTKSLEFRNDKLWEEHFLKHGNEFGYSTKEEYLKGANEVINSQYSLHKLEAEDNDEIYYDEDKNEIVFVSSDGYIRTLKHDAKIIVNGQLAPIVGNICMDQFMIDVTDIPNVKTGDEVILLGESNGIKFNADDIAKCMNSINYEVLCLLKKRVPRAYIKSGQIIHVKNNV